MPVSLAKEIVYHQLAFARLVNLMTTLIYIVRIVHFLVQNVYNYPLNAPVALVTE